MFSFYFNYQLITDCSIENLHRLYQGIEGGDEIIEGILRDKEIFESEQNHT